MSYAHASPATTDARRGRDPESAVPGALKGQPPGLADAPAALLPALLADPMTGFVVACPPHRIEWANALAARIIGGPGVVAALGGRDLVELFPEGLMREIGTLGARPRGGSPAPVLRVIWHDREVLVRVIALAGVGLGEAPVLVLQLRWSSMTASDLESLPEPVEPVRSLVMRLDLIGRLTPREIEVLAMVGEGMTIREIAGALFRSEKTIQNHRDAIGTKLGMRNRVELASAARRAGLTVDDAARKRV